MFNEPSQLLHPSNPVLSKARLYPSFLEDGKNFACMLVLPGGGYGHVSHQEGPTGRRLAELTRISFAETGDSSRQTSDR